MKKLWILVVFLFLVSGCTTNGKESSSSEVGGTVFAGIALDDIDFEEEESDLQVDDNLVKDNNENDLSNNQSNNGSSTKPDNGTNDSVVDDNKDTPSNDNNSNDEVNKPQGDSSIKGGETFDASYFGIQEIYSSHDEDGDGVDDYHDLLYGARAYIATKPIYNGNLYPGGYPPAGIGVCTDVVWYAFQQAGYTLKDMVDEDIRNNPERYTNIKTPNPDIDFRRTTNLEVFFAAHATSLTTDHTDIAAWQPGDIVFYDGHVGILSDKRNPEGIPYLIHHGAISNHQEDDDLLNMPITGHYRWVR